MRAEACSELGGREWELFRFYVMVGNARTPEWLEFDWGTQQKKVNAYVAGIDVIPFEQVSLCSAHGAFG